MFAATVYKQPLDAVGKNNMSSFLMITLLALEVAVLVHRAVVLANPFLDVLDATFFDTFGLGSWT